MDNLIIMKDIISISKIALGLILIFGLLFVIELMLPKGPILFSINHVIILGIVVIIVLSVLIHYLTKGPFSSS